MKIKIALAPSSENLARVSNLPRVRALIDQIRVAKEYEFHSIFLGQHFLSWPLQMMQPIPLLARLAAEAGDMYLGTGILLLPLYHPVDAAEQVATIDTISNGHFIFGIGLGYEEEEFHAFGIDKKLRASRFEESLEIIKKLLTQDTVDYSGKHFRLAGVRPTSRPIHKPYPPVWIAGNNHPAVMRAARMGDTWFANPMGTVNGLKELMNTFMKALSGTNRPVPEYLPLFREVYLEKDRESAFRRCRPFLEERFKVYRDQGQDAEGPESDRFGSTFEDLIRDRFIIGNPDDFFHELARYREIGFNYFALEYQWTGMGDELALAFLELMGNEILPSL